MLLLCQCVNIVNVMGSAHIVNSCSVLILFVQSLTVYVSGDMALVLITHKQKLPVHAGHVGCDFVSMDTKTSRRSWFHERICHNI